MTNPIEAVVAPLKADAIESAAQYAMNMVEKVKAKLEESGWDLNAAAPYPHGCMGRNEYQLKHSTHTLFCRLTKTDESKKQTYNFRSPRYVVIDSDKVSRFIEDARTQAGFQYDAFVAKLVAKIGECSSAKLTGNHVWSHSILTVQKASGEESWKTQTIINTSKLGTVFNQWPTRKLKGGK